MWTLQGRREGHPEVNERYRRQGTAWRRARQLYTAGYAVSAIQYSVEEPPRVMGVYVFDGIRFERVRRLD